MKAFQTFALLALAGLLARVAFPQDINNPQLTAAGTITSAGSGVDCTIQNACVYIVVPAAAASAAVQISGTFSATLQIESSVAGVTYTNVSTQTAAGTYPVMLLGSRYLRVRASAWVSGSITVAISATTGATSGLVVGAANFTAQAANIANTTLYTVPSTGTGSYRASCYVVVTQAATTSSTLPECQVAWTDADTGLAVSQWVGTTATGNYVGYTGIFGVGFFNAKAGSIQILTGSYASSGATPMQYALHAKVEFLGQ